MKIITISGSLRFKKEIMEIALKMELEGNIVITPTFPISEDKDAYTDEEMKMIIEMHHEKIKLADVILVVNVDGYIGKSTSEEIEFAKSLNKEIIYYTDVLKEEGRK